MYTDTDVETDTYMCTQAHRRIDLNTLSSRRVEETDIFFEYFHLQVYQISMFPRYVREREREDESGRKRV